MTRFHIVSNRLTLLRYLRLKEGIRRKSLGLYLPHQLLILITRSDFFVSRKHQNFVILTVSRLWFAFSLNYSASLVASTLQSCDLWSLGVIIYVMLCGYPPFYSKHHSRTIPKDMRKKIMTGSFDFPEDEWSQISEMAKDIVRK